MFNKLLAVALLAASGASAAHADMIRINFSGTGTGGAQGSNNVFGTPVPTVNGYLVYDSDAAATSTTGPTATNYANAITAFVVDFGSGIGATFDDGRSTGSVQVRDAAGADSLGFNNVRLGGALIDGAESLPAGTTYSFTTLFRGGPEVFDGQELFELVDATMFNQANLSFNVLRPAGSPPAGTVFFNYLLDLDNIEIVNLDQPQDVPAPGALALLALGLGGIAVRQRCRKVI